MIGGNAATAVRGGEKDLIFFVRSTLSFRKGAEDSAPFSPRVVAAAARTTAILWPRASRGRLLLKTLGDEGETVREFYSALSGPILAGIEATGSMQWFLELMEELGIVSSSSSPCQYPTSRSSVVERVDRIL